MKRQIRKNNYENLKIDYFEKIDTKEKAYWLGFLYADGYISKDEKRLSLNLSLKDETWIDKFLIDIGMGLDSKRYFGPYKNTGKFVQISLTNKVFVKNLINHGCTNKKTFTISFPNLESKELDMAFLLGYYDGDGSANSAIICCGNEEFLKKLKEKFNIPFAISKKKNKYGSAFYLNLGANLKKEMIKNYPFSMERKKLKPKYDFRKKKNKICTCGISIWNTSETCLLCYFKIKDSILRNSIKKSPEKKIKQFIQYKFNVTKEELEKLIQDKPYTDIGKMFNVSGNAIKKRAKKLGIVLENRKGYWSKKVA